MDQDVKPAFLVPPSAEVKAAEAAAAGLRLTAIEFFPVVVILGMMVGAAAWLRPSVEAQTHQHHSLLYRAVTWPARRLIHAVGVIEHRIMHAMSKWLAPKVGTVAHAFNSLTHEINMLAQVVADTADNTHEALTFLRHKVIPDLIQDALQPIRQRLKVIEDGRDYLAGLLRTAADEIADQLATLGFTVGHTFTAAIGQLAARFVQLWNLVHETVVPQLKELQEVVIPVLERGIATLTETVTVTIPAELDALRERLDDFGNRIGKMEDYIVSAAFIALIVAAVEKAFQFLTCRNMKRFGNEACAMEEVAMDSLLGLMFAGLVLTNIRELTRLAQSVEGEVVSLVKGALDA